MKTLKLLGTAILLFFVLTSNGQSAKKIINNYLDNIGGEKAWEKIESMRVTGIGKQQGVDYPFVATFMKDGRSVIDVDIQGNSFIVEAFDGETAWAMNFQTQKAEAYDAEASINYKNEARDQMSNAFLDYKKKGYSIELIGKDTWEGTEVHKIKLLKKPVLVDGKEEDNIDLYYFDLENNVPIGMETVVKTGPAKGATAESIFSDYQEVDGLYLPFTTVEKFNGQVNLEMLYAKVEFNITVNDSIFKMPKQ